MSRRVLIGAVAALALALALGGAALAATWPSAGGWLYRADIAAETRLHGLVRIEVDGGDSRMAAWLAGPADAAETIVMIHGYSADKTVWMRFAPHFTDRYRVLVLDLPGHGETAFDPALRYDTTSQAGRVIHALDALHIERAHLVGNSMGGFIAARLAHDYPARVQSATLMDAAGLTPPEPSAMGRMLAAGRNPFEVHSPAEFREFYAMTMADPPWVPGITLDWIAADYQARRESLARIFADFHATGLLDGQLGEIHTPVLVMWGAKDQLVSPSAAPLWAQGIAGARLVVYADLGHMPMVEAPARSAADVRAFIDSARR